jgi:hypothetical protein
MSVLELGLGLEGPERLLELFLQFFRCFSFLE